MKIQKCKLIITPAWIQFEALEDQALKEVRFRDVPGVGHDWSDFAAAAAGGVVSKNLPAYAGDMSLISGVGRLHMPCSNKVHVPQLPSLCSRVWNLQVLNLYTTITKACVPRAYALPQEQPTQEAQRHGNKKEFPFTATRASLCKAMKTQCDQK